MNTLKEAAQSALDVQSAPNLSGVVHAFSRAMTVVCREENDLEHRRTHPVCVLYATHIAFLTGVSSFHHDWEAYEAAYKACERMAAT